MKTFTAALSTHYASRATTLAVCLAITRTDGRAFRLTSHDQDLVVNSDRYLAGPGLDLSDLAFTAGLAPDNLELKILYADDAITREDLIAGRWDNAAFTLFEVNCEALSAGTNILATGTTGEVRIARDDGFTVELRSLKQALQKPVGIVTQKTCRYRLGDSRCGVDLAPYTLAGEAVSGVTSQRVFAASGIAADSPTYAADWWKEGLVTFTTGDNAGVARKVKTSSGATIELVAPMPFAIVVGDLFTIVAGCQKRLEADCRDKFDNVLNFGGEPHLPGVDALTAVPDPGA